MAALRVCGSLRTGRKRSAFLVRHLNLKRVSRTARRRCCAHPRALCRSCGFLGPCSCRSQKRLTSQFRWTGKTLGQFRLLLHGYFFLDSGRRQIEGLTASAKDEEPSDASGLRRAWNSELRDFVVLPLLPALLRDALNSKMVTSAELAQLVAAIAGSEWFQKNRSAICKESALVRVLEAPGGIVWRLVPSGRHPPSAAEVGGRCSWEDRGAICGDPFLGPKSKDASLLR